MIIYRQKQYSSRLTKAFYKIEKIKDRMKTESGDRLFEKLSNGVTNTVNKVRDSITPPLNPTETFVNKKIQSVKLKRLSPARRAVINRNNLRNGLHNTRVVTEYAVTNPGDTVRRSIETIAKYPIAGASQVAGKVAIVADPLGAGLHPFAAYGIALEKLARKGYPGYVKATDNWSNKFRSGIGKKVEGGINGVVDSIKNLG